MKYGLASSLFAVIILAGCAGTDLQTSPSHADRADVVALIDGQPILLSEFERRYAKSVGGREIAETNDEADYVDFLERYVDFRLKVKAGTDAGLPDDPDLSREIESYRTNFARPYLLEQEVLEPLMREAFERQKEMVRARHILIRVAESASPADTLAAYDKLKAISDSVAAGADFGEMAYRHSEDPSARREEGLPGSHGDLGFFSAGQMVEPFESYAYSTEVGSLSPIFRTSFGYHILEVQDRQATPSAIRVAHIMIVPSEHRDEETTAREFAEQLRDRVLAGEDFETLAREYSHDPNSRPRGGDLGVIPFASRLVEPFKSVAFGLESVGDVSEVVETNFGFHVIKLLDREEPPTFEEAAPSLKQAISQSGRAQEAEQALIRRMRGEMAIRVDSLALESAFSEMTDLDVREFAQAASADSIDAATLEIPVASVDDEEITVGDLIERMSQQQRPAADSVSELLLTLTDAEIDDRVLDAGTRTLENEDIEFGELMQEFRDGLILFRFMEDYVWGAASKDTLALKAIYDGNPEMYRYPDRTRVLSVSASRDTTIRSFFEIADAEGYAAARDSIDAVRVDTTFLTGPTNSRFDEVLELTPGARTEATRQAGRFVVLVNDGTEPARLKTFEEARPEILTVYQEQLEKDLLQDLRQRYSVTTFPERARRAFERDADVATTSP